MAGSPQCRSHPGTVQNLKSVLLQKRRSNRSVRIILPPRRPVQQYIRGLNNEFERPIRARAVCFVRVALKHPTSLGLSHILKICTLPHTKHLHSPDAVPLL